MAIIEELVSKYNKTVLMVTHDPVIAERAHVTLHLEKGVLVEASKLQQNIYAGGAA
jgi:putative ABC transport system ATP-binding protein